MSKTDRKRIQITTKDKALAILTTGVHTLSIDYENRRQVFVESHNDVKFYDKFYDKLKNELMPEISLTFISSGRDGNGDSGQASKIVKLLRDGGNKKVYGIIDWDKKNNGNKHVLVLGQNQRYSIENYILDPIIVAAFLGREKLLRVNVFDINYLEISTFDDEKFQKIADFVIERVKAKIQMPSGYEKVLCTYVGKHTVEIPKWYLHYQGHDLAAVLQEVFPELKRYGDEDNLKLEILKKVVDDMPSLIPLDILDLFKQIQSEV